MKSNIQLLILLFLFFYERKRGKGGNLSWRLPLGYDHSDTLPIGPDLWEQRIRMNHNCALNSIEDASDHELRV